jgi:hypothetical protein
LTCIVGVCAAGLLAAPSAHAASQFTFAIGSDPDIAVDGAGTAHVVWNDETLPADSQTVDYCQIPRGATGCTQQQTLYTGNVGAPSEVMLPAPGQVLVLLGADVACPGGGSCNGVVRSFDGGASFGPVQAVSRSFGAVDFSPILFESGAAVPGPGDTVSYIGGTCCDTGFAFVNASLGGGVESGFAPLDSSGGVADASVGLFDGRPVVASDRFDGRIVWQAYTGSGEMNNAANWTAPQVVDANSGDSTVDEVKLASGPGGLFLMYLRGPSLARQYVVRQFTGSGFGPAVGVSDTGDPIFGDLSEDGAGRLHALWVDNGAIPNTLRWASSTAGGVAWGESQTLHDDGDHVYPEDTIAAAPDGQGFAAWESREGGPNGSGGELRAIPLEPAASTADPCVLPTCLPSGGEPTKDLGDKHTGIEVSVPSCGSDEVTASFVLRHRKSKTKVKAKKVIFRLDGGPKIVDKKKPYQQTLHLADTTPGSVHTLTVKAKMKIRKKHHKPKKKVLKLSKDFYYCP